MPEGSADEELELEDEDWELDAIERLEPNPDEIELPEEMPEESADEELELDEHELDE